MKMSPRNQVLPLNYMCIKLISCQLIQALSDDEGQNYAAVEKYLIDTTYEVVQDILKNILNSVNLDAATRFSCLQLLLRQDVRKLDTGIFPHSYYADILKTISEKGTGLQQLNLKGVWVRDNPELLSNLIESLNKLKVLIIPHMADDQVLDAVITCKYLKVLDISGECSFTVEGLKKLKSDIISVLEIGCFGKEDVCQQQNSSFELIAQLIENFPNLNCLRTYSFTGSALFLFKKNSKCIKYKTKLKYLHDTNTSMEIIEAISDLCPNLESINLDCPKTGVIEELSKLKKLNCLKLTKPKGEELLNYLKTSGCRLQTLKLNHNKNYSLDLSEICFFAPNLLTLECFQMKLSFSQLDAYFMNLQNIEILYCDILDSSLKCILLNSPFLKRIIVGCDIRMTDGDIFRLCAECDFIYLEELWFSCAKGLTATSVELLMGHCPNLKVLGQLSGWDIHQEEVDFLRSVIMFTNTDLTLLPVGPFL